MLQRIISAIARLAFVVILVGCGGGGDSSTPAESSRVSPVASAATIIDISSADFTKVGYGLMAGFSIVCPVESGGCRIDKMMQRLSGTGIPVGVDINTMVNGNWWYQLPTTAEILGGGQSFVLNSPIVLPAGQTARVSIESAIPSGHIEVYQLDITSIRTGKLLGIDSQGKGCVGVIAIQCEG